MYYNSYQRIKRAQELLEKVAFISVGSDIFIAVSTWLVIQNMKYSNSLLMLSDYLNLVFVVIAVTLFISVYALRYSTDIPKKLKLLVFKATHKRYRPSTPALQYHLLFKTIRMIVMLCGMAMSTIDVTYGIIRPRR